MDFALTEMQKMLRTSSRDFLKAECSGRYVREMTRDEKGYSIDLWDRMAEMGWMGLIVPEQYGGVGGNFQDLVVLLEEMGRACLPGPFFSTVVRGGLTILEAGNEEQKGRLLPRLSEGKMLLTLALTEAGGMDTAEGVLTTAVRDEKDFILQGTKLFVPDAHVSDYIICAARTHRSENPEDGITLFLVDRGSPGLTTNLLSTIAGDKQCEVVFDGVRVPAVNMLGSLHEGWPVLERVLGKAAMAQCAQMVGGARQVLEMTADYAGQRKAFGHTISSFQAIQHYFADMIVQADGASLMVYHTAWRIDAGMESAREVSMTKALVNEACRMITRLCIQIHGAVGFTEDHDAQLFFKRAKAGEMSLGSTSYHLDKLTGLRLKEALSSNHYV